MDRKGSWKMTAGQVFCQPMYKSIIKENFSINLGEWLSKVMWKYKHFKSSVHEITDHFSFPTRLTILYCHSSVQVQPMFFCFSSRHPKKMRVYLQCNRYVNREVRCMIHKIKKCQILSHVWRKAKKTTMLFISPVHGNYSRTLVDAWHFGPVHYQPQRNSYYSGSTLIK